MKVGQPGINNLHQSEPDNRPISHRAPSPKHLEAFRTLMNAVEHLCTPKKYSAEAAPTHCCCAIRHNSSPTSTSKIQTSRSQSNPVAHAFFDFSSKSPLVGRLVLRSPSPLNWRRGPGRGLPRILADDSSPQKNGANRATTLNLDLLSINEAAMTVNVTIRIKSRNRKTSEIK